MSEAGQTIRPVGIAVNEDPTRLVVDAKDYDTLCDENTRLREALNRISKGADGIEPQEYQRWLDSEDSIDMNFWRWLAKNALDGGKGVQGG